MKIAFVSNLVEPTGGDTILYYHVTGLRKFHHIVDPYFAGWIDAARDKNDKEGWNSSDPTASGIIEYVEENLFDIDFSDYDIIIGNGLQGATRVLKIDHPNKVWFCQNYDPYVFGRSKEVDRIYNEFDKYLVYSHDLKKIIEHYHGKKKIVVCNNGINYKEFEPYQKNEFKKTKKICFMVAYYRNYKGIKFANEIFRELKKRGYITVEINATVGPLENTIEFYRNPSFNRKCEIVADCDFSIHPSAFETWGLVPMESMAIGTPVVGVDSKGIMEYVSMDNPQNAFIYKERDPKLMADVIDSLYNTENGDYAEIQKNGIITAKEHDWEKIMPEIEEAYEELL